MVLNVQKIVQKCKISWLRHYFKQLLGYIPMQKYSVEFSKACQFSDESAPKAGFLAQRDTESA
jgi:hypothetical protein